MAHHEMIDGVMKELMGGIKISTEPINQHNCAYNDTGAISNTGQCVWSWWGEGQRGVSQCQAHTHDVLWLLKEHSSIFTCRTQSGDLFSNTVMKWFSKTLGSMHLNMAVNVINTSSAWHPSRWNQSPDPPPRWLTINKTLHWSALSEEDSLV